MKKLLVLLLVIVVSFAGCNEEEEADTGVTVSSITITSSDFTIPSSSGEVFALPIDLPVSATTALIATANYSDGSTEIVTNDVIWRSADNSVVGFSDNVLVAKSVSASAVNVTASFSGSTGSVSVTVNTATLSDITITDAELSATSAETGRYSSQLTIDTLPIGAEKALIAYALFTNNTTFSVTKSVTWSSVNTELATIDSDANIDTKMAGTVNIYASISDVNTSLFLTVSDATLSSITVVSARENIEVGNTLQYTATANYENSSNADDDDQINITNLAVWSSDDVTLATVSQTGEANGLTVGYGLDTINVAYKELVGSSDINVTQGIVSLQARATATILTVSNQTTTLTARATYSDGSQEDIANVVWTYDASYIMNQTLLPLLNGTYRAGFTSGVVPIIGTLSTGETVTITITVQL